MVTGGTFICCRLIATSLLARFDAADATDALITQLKREAMVDAEHRGIDLLAVPKIHVERGPSGAPDGQTLVVAYGPARHLPGYGDAADTPADTVPAVDG